jgi:hypothetical protein
MAAAPTVTATRAGLSARMVTLVVAVPTGTTVNAVATTAGTGYTITVDVGSRRSQVGISKGGGMWQIG